MKAVKRFDPTRSVRLSVIRHPLDQGEIHEYIIKNWRMVKIARPGTTNCFSAAQRKPANTRAGRGATSPSPARQTRVIKMDQRLTQSRHRD